MDSAKKQIRSYMEEFRELVEDRAWSSAVHASRSADFQGWVEAERVLVSVRIGQEKKSVRMEFTISEFNYLSDCSCQDDPCIHLLCGIILVHSKWDLVSGEGSDIAPAGNAPYLEYHVSFQGRGLNIERMLRSGEHKTPFRESLVEYVGGVSSGRIQADMPMVSTDDYILDRALGQRKEGSVQAEHMKEAMQALSRLSHVFYEAKNTQVARDHEVYEFYSRIDPEGVVIDPSESIPDIFSVKDGVINWRVLPDANLERLMKYGMQVSYEELSAFLEASLPKLQKRCTVHAPSGDWPDLVDVPPRLVFQTEALDSGFVLIPRIEYGEPPLARIGKGGSCELVGRKTIPRRDLKAEIAISKQVQRQWRMDLGDSRVVTGEQAVQAAEMLASGEVYGDIHKVFLPQGSLTPMVSADGGKLDLRFYASEQHDETVDFETVMESASRGASVLRLSSGSWVRLPKDWLAEIAPLTEHGSGSYSRSGSRMSTSRVLQIAPFIGEKGISVVRDFLESVSRVNTEKGELSLPEGILLRAYQEEGVRWMTGLSGCENMGALLADDMGLGKTIQTLASLRFPSLVIVPTSLLPQWEDALRQWYPAQSLCVYHGTGRSWDSTSDIVLSTYGVLRNESALFSSRVFEMIVLDEIQTIKNLASAVSEAAFSLQGNFRLGLTGTPVENSVTDLWSIFNFILPGLLPEPERLHSIIETEQGVPLIRKMITPFILRRKKSDVLKELPEKTEIVVPCVMEEEQRSMYESFLHDARDEARKYLSQGKGYMSLFEKLLRLRQICVHPMLLGDAGITSSVKIETSIDYLERITTSGHKVLLFSQWTSALDLIEALLASCTGAPLRIDGSTTNRAAVLSRFREDPEVSVLLLSLKAGGVGLNLVEADHVVFLDPWWNPAVEKQAEDRVHRIGQENPVFVYRMIVKDSIEEKILELHKRKSQLSEALLEGNASRDSSLSEEDLRFLLSF
jgi:superfamily II DNA or RNA helicase